MDLSLEILLFIIRMFLPILGFVIVYECFSSMRSHRRGKNPLIMLKIKQTSESIPVMYWESSIGRSKTSDIVLQDPSVSREHAVLLRRKEGWIISDTGSKKGVLVNGEKIAKATPVYIGDSITIGATCFTVKKIARSEEQKASWFFNKHKKAIPPIVLLLLITIFHFLMSIQAYFNTKKDLILNFTPFALVCFVSWFFFFITMVFAKRASFELESLGVFLSGIGIILIGTKIPSKSAYVPINVYVQCAALFIGMFMFCFLVWFIKDLQRVMRWRMAITILALLFFAINLVIGKEVNGSKNWIFLGGLSIQPSEFIKIAFIFAGSSTLDRLQTTKNLTGFILFSCSCVGCLFLMRDFGTACVFFVTFLIVSFMRSGSIRTVILSCSAAIIGAVMILQFKPYIAERFLVWRHVWEHVQTGGYQQTRVLTYAASGGFFGAGTGLGNLKYIFAGMSDLMFGMLCEELGLILALIIAFCVALMALFSQTSSICSRSTFYAISSCAASGMLVFQSALHIFGATDILPITGVTLPFVSLGGSSMISVWGLLAFIKASDEYTYAVQKK